MIENSHICFLAAWYPDERDPMFGLFIQKHASILANAGHTISVIVPTYYKDIPNQIFTYVNSGIHVTFVNIKSNNKLFRWLSFFIAMHKAYRFVIKKHGKPIVNHVHVLTRMGIIAAIIRWRFGIPYVITEHWSRYFEVPGTYRNVIRKTITRYICNYASGVSAVSHKLQEAMKIHRLGLKKRWFTINNVVDPALFSVPPRQPDSNPVRFLNVSCFEDRSKNLTGLLRVVRRLADQRNDFICMLAGTGADEAIIRKQAEELALQNHVIFTGLLSPAGVAELMKSCHFYVQASRYENVPVVISEALMAGLPVIATNVGAVSEMLSEKDGFLIQDSTDDELFAALSLMCDEYDRFDRNDISHRAAMKYSPEAVLEQFVTLYRSIEQ